MVSYSAAEKKKNVTKLLLYAGKCLYQSAILSDVYCLKEPLKLERWSAFIMNMLIRWSLNKLSCVGLYILCPAGKVVKLSLRFKFYFRCLENIKHFFFFFFFFNQIRDKKHPRLFVL